MTSERWIMRYGGKQSGFRYVDSRGKPIRAASQLARIKAMRIPPAWRGVHIAASSRAAVQGWGIDAKGRRQYRYHQRAVERGAQRKHYRVRRLARDLPKIRDALRSELQGHDLTRQRVTAGLLRLIADGFFRVGSERYAKENNTYGVSTLLKSHVSVHGDRIQFTYIGKRAIKQRQVIVDRELAGFVGELLDTPGTRLFRYLSDSGWCDVSAREVNDYVRRITGVRYSAKDFRTWGGTLRMATVLAELDPTPSVTERKRNVVMAVRLVAAELGNTPAICRASYVHPMVIARYLDSGDTIRPRRATGSGGGPSDAAHSPEERALIAFLNRHFPERRRRLRAEDRAAA